MLAKGSDDASVKSGNRLEFFARSNGVNLQKRNI